MLSEDEVLKAAWVLTLQAFTQDKAAPILLMLRCHSNSLAN